MTNPYLLIGELGMVIIGLAAIIYWRARKKTPWKFFAFGAAMWVIAIAAKLAMDLTVTMSLYQWLTGFGGMTALYALSVYYGLRTGFFESGFSYLGIKWTRFKKMDMNQAIAFGVGFGAIEAVLLGLQATAVTWIAFTDPTFANALSPGQLASLNMPTIVLFAPLIERLSTIAVHVFASLLVVYAVVKKKANYLAYSIAYKSLLDFMVPLLAHYLELTTVTGAYLAEVPIAIFGIASYYGIRWMMKNRKF